MDSREFAQSNAAGSNASGFAFGSNPQIVGCCTVRNFHPLGWEPSTSTTSSTITTTTTTTAPACDIFVALYTKIGIYNIATNNIDILITEPVEYGFNDIANTTDKLWVPSTQVGVWKEYDLILNPITLTFNRNIAFGVLNIGGGLVALDNTHLISSENSVSGQILMFDITNSPATKTVIGVLPAGYTVTGDLMLTTNGKLLIIANNSGFGSKRKIFQYTYPGFVLEGEVDISTLIGPWGIAQRNGNIYLFSYNNSTGETDVHTVGINPPYTLTYIESHVEQVLGASQLTSCCPVSLNVTTSTSTTQAPTTTLAPTTTSTTLAPTTTSTSTTLVVTTTTSTTLGSLFQHDLAAGDANPLVACGPSIYPILAFTTEEVLHIGSLIFVAGAIFNGGNLWYQAAGGGGIIWQITPDGFISNSFICP